MPLDLSILKLPEFEIVKTEGINPVIYRARYKGSVSCPFCDSLSLKKKSRYTRKLRHETIGLRRPTLS